jgi:hypothetical protein
VYRSLALVYKYTPAQIADMTPLQQQVLLTTDKEKVADTMVFDSFEEVLQYKASINK